MTAVFLIRYSKFMIIYSDSKKAFCDDTLKGLLIDKVHKEFTTKAGRKVAPKEFSSWTNSLMFMNTVIATEDIPDDSKISIEYHLPATNKRVDFIITGKDELDTNTAIIIELKQWQETFATRKSDIIETFLGGKRQETVHPCYQAWSYAKLLQDFNEVVQIEEIKLKPCAFLHNHPTGGPVSSDFYSESIAKAPIFLKTDFLKLRDFIKKYIKKGDNENILYRIDNGRIRPSKQLASHVEGLMKGRAEFTLIDEQKVCFELALAISNKAEDTNKKQVLIVRGGPGTGKTVLAINLLSTLLSQGRNVRYTSKNAAPREVYKSKLIGNIEKTKTHISFLFSGSGAYKDSEPNEFDVLICDEAHRLNEKSGLYNNEGINQVMEIIRAANTSIFFLDEDQRVSIFDIGSEKEIEKWAKEQNAELTIYDLASQFRCNGSDAYISWLDNTLQVRPTANAFLNQSEFEFQVIDNPHDLKNLIQTKNKNSKSRLVAGYCWPWNSAKDLAQFDIKLPKHNFEIRWNLKSQGSLWLEQSTTEEVGCIHTCQGLEMDYVGVIVGPDLVVRDGIVITDATKRHHGDKSVFGYKKMLKISPDKAVKLGDLIIKNTYRTLMTRGMKGCYIFSDDEETRDYFRKALGK